MMEMGKKTVMCELSLKLDIWGFHTILFTFAYVEVSLKWKKNLRREAKKKKKKELSKEYLSGRMKGVR